MVSKSKIAVFLFAGLVAACGGRDREGEAAKIEAGSPLETGFRLSDAEPVDIDAFFALFPASRRPSYETAAFDEKLGATVVEGVRIPGEDEGRSLVIARGEFYGLDLDAIERVRTGDASADGHETLFQKIRLLDIRSEGYREGGAAAALVIGGAEIDKFEMRPVGDRDNGAAALAALKLGGLYFKDFSFKTETGETPSIEFSAPDLRLVDYEAGRLGALIGKAFAYHIEHTDASLDAMRAAIGPQAALLLGPLKGLVAPDSQRTTIGEFEWRNIDFAGLMDYAARGEEPPISEKELLNLGTVRARALETHIDGRRAAYIEEATVSAADFTWLIPSHIRADTKGAVYDLTAYLNEEETETLEILRKHGLDKVTGGGVAEWRWNERTGEASLDYEAHTDKFADFRFELALSGFVYDEIVAAAQGGDENAVVNLGAFDGMRLILTDKNALDASFEIAALQMGGSPEDLRLSAPAMIRVMALQGAGVNRRIPDYADAVADFIAKGGALEIRAAPGEPVRFVSLQNGAVSPEALPDALNLTVEQRD